MLFNKTGNGTEELRAHFGSLYADFYFENLLNDINIATEYVSRYVSKEIIQAADTHYNSSAWKSAANNENQKLLDNVVSMLQLPIALYALIDFQANSDVSHQDTGRKLKIKDGEKIPFEWQLKRDEIALQKKADKALDRVLEFLDANKDKEPISSSWATSKEYIKSKNLFIINAKQFDEIFPIDESRQFFMRVCPSIQRSEIKHILPVIKKDKFDELKEKIKDDDLNDENDINLIRIIRNILVFDSLAEATQRFAQKYLPESIVGDTFELDSIKKTSLIASFKTIVTDESTQLQKAWLAMNPREVTEYKRDYTEKKFYRS